MAFRNKIKRSRSRKMFKRGATRINRKNVAPKPMRGGIRL